MHGRGGVRLTLPNDEREPIARSHDGRLPGQEGDPTRSEDHTAIRGAAQRAEFSPGQGVPKLDDLRVPIRPERREGDPVGGEPYRGDIATVAPEHVARLA